MKRPLIVAALPEELEAFPIDATEHGRLVTGPGKVNATLHLTQRLNAVPQGYYTEIINAGTCGAISGQTGVIRTPEIFVEWDFASDALMELTGRLWNTPVTFRRNDATDIIATGDQFVTSPSLASQLRQNEIDLVDMEAYAYARVCQDFGYKMTCLKYATDKADSMAPKHWKENVAEASRALHKAVLDLL